MVGVGGAAKITDIARSAQRDAAICILYPPKKP